MNIQYQLGDNLETVSLLRGGAQDKEVGPGKLFGGLTPFFCFLTGHLEGSSVSLLNILLHDVLPGLKPKDMEPNGLKLLKPGAFIWFSRAFCHTSRRIKDSVPNSGVPKFTVLSGDTSHDLEKDFKESSRCPCITS